MSSVKSLVRAAREAIDRADYATAVRLCETALEDETSSHGSLDADAESRKNGYTLLVFKALSLKNLGRQEEAASIYREANRLQPEQSLAWQGLASLYEEWADAVDGTDASEYWKRAVEPLERLATMSKGDRDRLVNYSQRLLQAYEMVGRLEAANSMLDRLLSPDLLPLTGHTRRDLLDRRIANEERQEMMRIDKEVQARRYRLGADPLPVLREKITDELVNQSSLEDLLIERLGLEPTNGSVNSSLVAKVIDRLMRKIPLVEGKDATRTLREKLLDFAKDHVGESTIAQQVIFNFTDWENIEETQSRPQFTVSDDSSSTGRQAEAPFQVFPRLQELVRAWESRDFVNTRKHLEGARMAINNLTKSYGAVLTKVQAQLKRLEGLLLVAETEYSQAIPILVHQQQSGPNNDQESMLALATAYSATGAHPQAIATYQQLLLAPSLTEEMDLMVRAELGWLYHLNGDQEQALSLLQDALGMQSNRHHQEPNRKLLSLLHCRLGIIMSQVPDDRNNQASYKHFVEACQADVENAEPFYRLGCYYQQSTGKGGPDLVRAEKCFLKACSLQPTHLDAALALARLWIEHCVSASQQTNGFRVERLHRVVDLLEPHVKANKTLFPSLDHYLAVAYEGVGRWSDACSAYHRALKLGGIDNNRAILLLGLGRVYHRMGKLLAARQTLEELLSTGPDDKNGRDRSDIVLAASVALAMVQMDLKKYGSAREILMSIAKDRVDTQVIAFVRVESLRAGYQQFAELLTKGCLSAAVTLLNELILTTEKWISEKPASTPITLASTIVTRDLPPPLFKILADMLLLLVRIIRTEEIKMINLSGLLHSLQGRPEICDNEVWRYIEGLLVSSNPLLHADIIKVTCLAHLVIIMQSGDEPVMASSWCDIAVALMLGPRMSLSSETAELHAAILEFCGESLRLFPSPTTYLAKGVAHLRANEWALAQDAFIRALPVLPSAWLNLALLYGSVGHSVLAHTALSRILVEEAPIPTSRGGKGIRALTTTDYSLLAQAWLYEAFLERLEAKEEHHRPTYVAKLYQAALLCPPLYDDHVYGLALASYQGGDGDEYVEGEVTWWAQCRLSYAPKDELASKILSQFHVASPAKTLAPPPELITACGKLLFSEDSGALMTVQQQLSLLPDDTDERTWLLAASHLLAATEPGSGSETEVIADSWTKSLAALTECLDHLGREGPTKASLRAWQDLLFFTSLVVDVYVPRTTGQGPPRTFQSSQVSHSIDTPESDDKIQDLLRDWMRLRLSPEVVRRIHQAPVAEIILHLFPTSEVDMEGILKDTIAFTRDMQARGILTIPSLDP